MRVAILEYFIGRGVDARLVIESVYLCIPWIVRLEFIDAVYLVVGPRINGYALVVMGIVINLSQPEAVWVIGFPYSFLFVSLMLPPLLSCMKPPSFTAR